MFSPDFVEMVTFLACNASAKLSILNQFRAQTFSLLTVKNYYSCSCRGEGGGGGYQGKNRVALTNVVINVGYQYYCFENFFSKFVFSEFIFKFISYKSRSFSSDYFYFAKITAFI